MPWSDLDLWLGWVNGDEAAEVTKQAAVSGAVLDDSRAFDAVQTALLPACARAEWAGGCYRSLDLAA